MKWNIKAFFTKMFGKAPAVPSGAAGTDVTVYTIPLGTPNEHVGPAAPGGTDVLIAGQTYINAAKELVELEAMYEFELPNRAAAAALVEPEMIRREAMALYIKIENPVSRAIISKELALGRMGKGIDASLTEIVEKM
ncbi:MAG: hypothetical protein JW791_05425 [Nanoarchaeota archaeon]|nr:hypothetical protein [Nanoarchaeota archaeon]